MKILRWRYSAVLGMLLLVGFLFCFSSTQGYAYPAPQFQYARVFSIHRAGVLNGTKAIARVSGPSPEDVASFVISASGDPHHPGPMVAGISSQQLGLFYTISDPGIAPDGAYTFKIVDTNGRTVTTVRDFSYNGTVPQVDSTTLLPLDKAYVGKTTPTLSFSPVAGNYLYQILILDINLTAIWYSTQASSATSYTIPTGTLQPNTPYVWYVRVWDTSEQNCHETTPIAFYTGTKDTPVINLAVVMSFPWNLDFLNYPLGRGINVAPWDISYFQCTGPDPDNAVYGLLGRRYYGFNIPFYNANITTFNPPASIPNGTYTFEIQDDLGRTASTTREYTYVPIPDFIADTRSPADNAYSGTDRPTFSWSRVQGDPGDGSYRYSIRITDYTTNMRWFDSPSSSDTTYTPTVGLGLPLGSSYKWRVNVVDPSGNNYRTSASPIYRTITLNGPEPAATPVPTLSEWGMIILSILLAVSAFAFIRRRNGAMS